MQTFPQYCIEILKNKLVENCEVKAKYIRSRKKEINAYCFERPQAFVSIHPPMAIRKGGKIIKEIGTFKPRKEEIK